VAPFPCLAYPPAMSTLDRIESGFALMAFIGDSRSRHRPVTRARHTHKYATISRGAPVRTQRGHEKPACGEVSRGGLYLIDVVREFGCGDRI
jgi:hypothetical protein